MNLTVHEQRSARKEKRKCSHEKLKHELDLKEWTGKNRVTKFSEMQTE